jgi:hypothetical protein
MARILTSGNGAPATDGVEADRYRAFRHQVGVFRTVDGEFFHMRIGLFDRFLVGPLLGRMRYIPDEVDREVKLFFVFAVGQHIFHGTDNAFRL